MAKQQTKTIHLTVKQALLVVVLLIVVSAVRWYLTPPAETYSMENIPPYDGTPYVVLNDNQPSFTEEDMTDVSYEFYSDLDELGRCGVTEACIGRDLMPTEKRGDISSVKPTGWVQNQYDFVDGKSLWNRCHLIGFQLAGENANECNLITGTRYLNVEGMLPFENLVADYVKETDNHVLYRVTPAFQGTELVARGVQMEAYSVEDSGDGVCFNVFCYNVQPGVEIDYATGDNWLAEEAAA
ncbi:DNA/RNA non-specific endonuclease [Oscillibacter valericigenes]|uniref:DNA/RNA non-specific endonuclease n=1 Tax=Oscillibacter valericigenes TaxID=351091 RepID=UPI0022866F95|nr:DNA/RNA non-specific endonuclease [Oscillibacter valericigenes]MCF2616749.1 DNA/RNA non-specific endonuclease [Oscillibacter valericigenes]